MNWKKYTREKKFLDRRDSQDKMKLTTSLRLRTDQLRWVKSRGIVLSDWVRAMIDQAMNEEKKGA